MNRIEKPRFAAPILPDPNKKDKESFFREIANAVKALFQRDMDKESRLRAIEKDSRTGVSATTVKAWDKIIQDSVDDHIADKANPHEVSASQAGAAPAHTVKVITTTPYQILESDQVLRVDTTLEEFDLTFPPGSATARPKVYNIGKTGFKVNLTAWGTEINDGPVVLYNGEDWAYNYESTIGWR